MAIFDWFHKKPDQPGGPPPDGPPQDPPPEAVGPAGAPVLPAATDQPQAPPPPAPAAGDRVLLEAEVTLPRQRPTGLPPTPPVDPQTGPPAGPTVEGFDAFGRRLQIPRDTYRTQVLPGILQQSWHVPAQLAAAILQALRDGLAGDVGAAADRLVAFDTDRERALAIKASVQREAGLDSAAAATLQQLLQQQPDSAAARVGLAALAQKQGRPEASEQLLWQALQHDADNPDALHAFLHLHQQRGKDDYAAALARLVALPGGWRAPLWQARMHLDAGDPAAALAIYRDVVQRAGDQSDALLMISGDLGRTGHHDAVAELVLPRYDVKQHHPNVGMNLLQHFVSTGQGVRGAQLLHELHLHYGHVLAQHLQRFTGEFDRLRLQALPPPTAEPRVSMYRIDRPSVLAGLDEPTWLLPDKPADGRQVVFLALAVDGALPGQGQEEELGRLTRSLPLFLAEQVWFGSPLRGAVALPIADAGGWVVSSKPWPEELLGNQLSADERARTVLVTGVLRPDGQQRRVDLWLYDCASRQRIGHAAAEGRQGATGGMALQLLAELSPRLGGPPNQRPPVGTEQFWDHYTGGLGQHAALMVAQAGAMPKERVFGQRHILQWLQAVVLEEPRWQPGWWAFASGICLDHALGSPVHREFARAFAELFRRSPAAAPFSLLAGKALRALGLGELWQQRRDEIAAAHSDAARAWLARIEPPAS